MKTNNIEGLSIFEINVLIQQGGKFVIFPYTISKLVKKIKNSNIYFIRPNENTFKYALKHFFINLSMGWRTFPFGPIYTIKSLYYLIIGGKDYTDIILSDLAENNPQYNAEIQYLQYS